MQTLSKPPHSPAHADVRASFERLASHGSSENLQRGMLEETEQLPIRTVTHSNAKHMYAQAFSGLSVSSANTLCGLLIWDALYRSLDLAL
jgi:hypothetical protein